MDVMSGLEGLFSQPDCVRMLGSEVTNRQQTHVFYDSLLSDSFGCALRMTYLNESSS